MHNLKPYPGYRGSGVPWLGAVPAHWEVLPNRALFAEVNQRNHPDEPLLSVTISRGVIRQAELLADSSKKDSSNTDKSSYKLVNPGDIAYNKMRAWQGAIGISPLRGIVSPAYIVVRPRDRQNARYFHYLLRTPNFTKEAERWSYGITSDQWSLRAEHFKMIYCSLPPEDEQAAIARFLDHADRQIRRYIRAKQKLIKLLEEQKQAIIHRAVTRGLNPDVRLKPSGVEWLGEVPEHWEVRPLKSLALIQSGVTLGKQYLGDETKTFPYLRVANVQAGHLDLSEVKEIAVPEREAQRSILRVGDVLMTEGGDADKLGRGCVWEGEIDPCLHQNHVFAVRPDSSRLYSHFLAALLASQYAKKYFMLTAKQTTNLASTNKTTIGNFPVLLPSLEEQRCILNELTLRLEVADSAIAGAKREISLISEHRVRLITDVVTGKLDVRDAAAKLPSGEFSYNEALEADDDPLQVEELAEQEFAAELEEVEV